MSHKNTIGKIMERVACGKNPNPEKCFEWLGAKNSNGYGSISVNRKIWGVHRFVWTSFNGEIPEGLMVLHRCDNPPCVRLTHLFLGTSSDNVKDCLRKGRAKPVKLSYTKAHEIRLLWRNGKTQTRIAEIYGVSIATVCAIVNEKTWLTPFSQEK